jgi:HEAT repeat protein
MYRIGWIATLCVVMFLATGSGARGEDDFSKNCSIALDPSKGLRDRIIAMHQLGETGGEGAAAPLLKLLGNPAEQEGIRCSAARELADLGNDRSEIIPALEKAYREPNAGRNLMYTILLCLGRMRAIESLPLMTDSLSDPRAMIRFKASQAIGELETEESVRVIVSHLAKEEDRMVRAEMVRALGGSQVPSSEKALVNALISDPEPLVRLNAALALKSFESLSSEARCALVRAQKDPSSAVRDAVKGVTQ